MHVLSSLTTSALSAVTRPTRRAVLAVAVMVFAAHVLYTLPISVAAADGDLDPSFDTDGRVITDFPGRGRGGDGARAVALQPDGKLVAVGTVGFGTLLDFDFALARYNTDGSLDQSFGTNGRVTTDLFLIDQAYAVAIQADGKIVAAGVAGSGSGSINNFGLARYNTDGSLDQSFGTAGRVITAFGQIEAAYSVAIQPDGKIVAAGVTVFTQGGAFSGFALARYNTDGSLDQSFGTAGRVTTSFPGLYVRASAVAIQADGRIVAAGIATTELPSLPISAGDFALARYNTDGSLDQSFGTAGRVTTDFSSPADVASAIAIQSDGKIVAAGSTGSPATNRDFALARYNSDGTLDESFDTDGRVTTDFSGLGDVASAVAIQADGRIVVAGGANGETTFGLARYNTFGALDTTFGTEGRVTTDFGSFSRARGVAIQADGKIVAAGSVSNEATSNNFALARYEAQGSAPAAADLALAISAAPEPVTAGSDLTYSITLTNTGPAAADSVIVTNGLPEATTFLSCTATEGGVCAGAGNSRSVTFDALAPGASATITLVVRVTCAAADGTSISNSARVSSATPDPEQSNNSAQATSTVSRPPGSFSVQDDATGDRLSFDSLTGDYTFTTCDGRTLSGRGVVIRRGCRVRLRHVGANVVVTAVIDVCEQRGEARVATREGVVTLSDADTTDNSCACP